MVHNSPQSLKKDDILFVFNVEYITLIKNSPFSIHFKKYQV